MTADLSDYNDWAPAAMRALAAALQREAEEREYPGHVLGSRHDLDCWCPSLDLLEPADEGEALRRRLDALAAMQGRASARAEVDRLWEALRDRATRSWECPHGHGPLNAAGNCEGCPASWGRTRQRVTT